MSAPFVTAFTQALRAELVRVKWIMAVLVAYLVVALVYVALVGEISLHNFGIYIGKFAFFFAFVLPTITVVWLIISSIYHHRADPHQHMRSMLRPEKLARFAVGLLVFVMLVPFWSTFTQVKNSLSEHGFLYDVRLADFERWLHGGVDATNWLARVGLPPFMLQVVQWNYNALWQIFHLLMVALMLLHPGFARVRNFYMIFYLMGWAVLGNVLAGTFISAGPIYYAHATGDAVRFAAVEALVASGKDQLHSAYQFQQYLWTAYERHVSALGSGISAFPSIHIFIATTNALFVFFYVRRWLGVLAMGYAGFVLLSSGYLGWHYLIDGYCSILYATTVFFAARWVMRRRGII